MDSAYQGNSPLVKASYFQLGPLKEYTLGVKANGKEMIPHKRIALSFFNFKLDNGDLYLL